MSKNKISIHSIPQLKDNYCHVLMHNNKAIIIDPAESLSVINYVEKNNLKIISILITHHHSDHVAGIEGILNYNKVSVYSPDKNIFGTSIVVKDKDSIDIDFINFEVIEAPGHTLDHIILHNKANQILFSGDVLFRLGCGRVFEGTYEDMYNSLNKINNLEDQTMVYCGHEYTLNNVNFLISIFENHNELIYEKKEIKKKLLNQNCSIPFKLGREKILNPFLSTKSKFYDQFKSQKKFSNIEMFAFLRDLKNNF
jgi:hydroxyacylglutathione hydrolase